GTHSTLRFPVQRTFPLTAKRLELRVRDVHRGIATSTGQCRHPFACKWLTPTDPRVLAGATSDDVVAAVHIWLGFVDVTGIESRENLVTVSVCQNAGAIDVFLGA